MTENNFAEAQQHSAPVLTLHPEQEARQAVEKALALLLPLGVLVICAYPGHTEGDRERAELTALLSRREQPLAAYCFGGDRALKRRLTECFPCGALVFNDVLIHFSNMHIPFGGVGTSGFGAYHGVRTFTTFTHEKPVMTQSGRFDLPFRYPPHHGFVRRLIEFFCRVR